MAAMNLIKIKKSLSITRMALVLLLIAIAAIGTIPGYLGGQWSWVDLPKVTQIERLKNLRDNGLTLPGWKTIEQQQVLIGGNQWSYQKLEREGKNSVELWLMPQDYYKNHPQVEWTDLNGFERWQTDSHKTLNLTDRVSASFFRAWNRKTYAVVQWYAWAGGGNVSSLQWFLADQWAQLHRRRAAWVAASLKIQIDPLSSVESTEAFAQSLAQTVRTTLEKEIFHPS
ncbi:MAG: cyanoexosortase B system-associated protein [Hydrococcus sp. C42_A2020_068]|nr:cyanoexosortase B system-associated protein [Hydrococcus sp. C42_A2020_068]